MKFAFKVDVDTYEGMQKGVPNLLGLFKHLGIRASFFIPFGPDESGKAVFRIFKKKGFLKKMFRTNALKLYGLKTMLRGTLLPAPLIGSSFPEIVRDVLKEGHELGIHGYNHVFWQDHLLEMQESVVREQFELGVSAFENVTGSKPRSFAAPAWLCSGLSLKLLDERSFAYASDTRGTHPYYPVMGGVRFQTLQLPSTLPTADEVLAWDGVSDQTLWDVLTQRLETSGIPVHLHSIHTELEGTALFGPFSKWATRLKEKGIEFVTGSQIADETLKNPGKIPYCDVVLSELPGRAGKVACQKS